MRTKEQILDQAVRAKPAPGSWDCVASLHERLTIEVLIDIRDELNETNNILASIQKIEYREAK